MSAEGMPPAEPSFLARPCAWGTRLVTRFPLSIVALAVTLALVALVYTWGHLGFHTSRLDLLNPNCAHNQLWIDYINEFGDQDDAVIVVQGASRDNVVPVLEDLSRALAHEDRLFSAILHEVNLSKIRAKGLHYLPPAELEKIDRFLDKVEPIIRGDWSLLNLGNMAGGMYLRLADKQGPGLAPVRQAAGEELGRLACSLQMALDHEGGYQSPWPEMPHSVATLSDLGSEYLLTNEGRLGFVLLQLAIDKTNSDFSHGTDAIDALRRLINQVQVRHPETEIGLTGLPIMENDEMRASQRAMMRASLLSLVGVACLFIAGFGGLRHPLMTVAALLLAMAWSFGYITIAIGHLNILSIAFGVILIGLGIDFGVHYAARYLQVRETTTRSAEALVQTACSVGPGIITGAVTTAIAFFMAAFTEFTGVAELGLIAGGGILLCCFGALTVLPAMIQMSDDRRHGEPLPAPLDIHGWLLPLFSAPRLLLFFAFAATAAIGTGMVFLKYDHNLLNLQAVGLESVELEQKLLSESDQSVWFALSIAESPEELLARKAQFLKLDSVERVEEIASLFPAGQQQKRPLIEHIHQRLADLPERPPPRIPVDPPADLGVLLARSQAILGNNPQAMRTERQLEQIRDLLRRMPLAECYRRLSDYQHRMAGDLLSRLLTLRAMSNPEPPRLSDLPESLVKRFVGDNGRYLLKIYSKANIWDMDAMERFVQDVRSIDPRATGNPLQTYEASKQMKQSYEKAAWYALGTIVLVLLLDFRSFRYTLLAMLPLGLGMLQLFGLLGLLGIPLNPANLIVLPLILGIGVDDGVHVVHDFRRQKGKYRMSASTASAVLITSLTTMVGFGSLMIASHQGLQSLGRVLTIGVSCCLFTSLVMLPAILIWWTQDRPEPEIPLPEAGEVPKRASPLIRRHDAPHLPKTNPHYPHPQTPTPPVHNNSGPRRPEK